MKLHLGAGKRFIPGFTHIDLADYPHIDIRHDVRRLSMFDDNTVDLIYACHVLEYFDRQEGVTVLTEWRRVLKPGGILRLAVPDADALARVYVSTGNLSLILGPLYGRMVVGETTIFHKTVYDHEALASILHHVGFRNPSLWDWRATEHSDIDDYSRAYIPHMDVDRGVLISLNMEAIK